MGSRPTSAITYNKRNRTKGNLIAKSQKKSPNESQFTGQPPALSENQAITCGNGVNPIGGFGQKFYEVSDGKSKQGEIRTAEISISHDGPGF